VDLRLALKEMIDRGEIPSGAALVLVVLILMGLLLIIIGVILIICRCCRKGELRDANKVQQNI